MLGDNDGTSREANLTCLLREKSTILSVTGNLL